MARLASDTKMGFYPTEVKSIQKVIEKTLELPVNREIYALDCCAGEGEAIEMIGKKYGCKTYAVELDENRAKTATNRNINVVLNEDALGGVRKSNRWVGINFLNPPYGTSSFDSRYELDFIERWGLTTAVGGVLILVINPSSADEKMANALRLQGYRPMYSFYDPDNADYKNYGQFFIVLHQQLPNFRASLDKFASLFDNPIDINSDFEIEKLKIRTGAKPQTFNEIETPRWKIEKQLQNSKLKKIYFDELRSGSFLNSSIENPNEGQSALLIASGAVNKPLQLKEGLVILKGTSNKEKKQVEQMNETTGEVDKVKLIDHYVTVVYGLNLTHGQFVKYN